MTQLGLEKVIVNSAAVARPELITEISETIGSQSTIASIDVRKKFSGHEVLTHSGKKKTNLKPLEWAQRLETLGAGEIILSSIDRESTFSGYDLDIISQIAPQISIPLVALGGARTAGDFKLALDAGAAATAAGSMFVLNGPHRAVLITYPKVTF
ncbi:MAG: HisA/HisF-related TIM barrel protein [Microbacteriaceae bacterium]